MGPVCRLNGKLENMNNGNLFASRAEYSYGIEGGIVWIEDNGGLKTVTNDIENILVDIAMIEDISKKRIMYRDSDKIWDGVTANIITEERRGKKIIRIEKLDFFPITETEFGKAKEKLLSK